MQKTAPRYIAAYLPLTLVLLIFFMCVCSVNNQLLYSWAIGTLLLAWAIRRTRRFTPTPVDYAVVAIYLYGSLSLLASPVGPLVSPHVPILNIATGYYFILRLYLHRERRIRFLLLACGTLFLLLALIAVVSFRLFADSVAGLGDLYDYRYLYRPMGRLSNMWGSSLIGMTGIMCLGMYYLRADRKKFAYLAIALVPVLFCAIVTFSRGVYLAFLVIGAVLFAALLRSDLRRGSKAGIALGIAALLLALTAPFRSDALRTVRFTETASQQRSISGRVEAGSLASGILCANPVTGAGMGNFTLAANDLRFEDENNPFTTFAGNTLFKLAAEQGAVGLFLWGSLVVAFLYLFFTEKRKGAASLIVFASLAAIGLRELTYPTFFDYSGYQLIVFTLIALYLNRYPGLAARFRTYRPTRRQASRLAWLPVLVGGALAIPQATFERDRHTAELFVRALDGGELGRAAELIGRTSGRTPFLIGRSLLHHERYRLSGRAESLDTAVYFLEKAIGKNPHDNLLLHNRAILRAEQGKKDSARRILTELAERFPNNPLYRLSLFPLLHSEGENDRAASQLARALFLQPALFESSLWRSCEQDTLMAETIRKELERQVDTSEQDPVLCAKYGKTLLFAGDTARAESLLGRAVSRLPNLSRPWYYLSRIAYGRRDTVRGAEYAARAVALDPGDSLVRQYTQRPAGQRSETTTDPYEILNPKYRLKYETWYLCHPSKKMVFRYL